MRHWHHPRATRRGLAAAMLLISVPSFALEAQQKTPAEIARELATTTMARDRLPSLSLAVARDGRVVFAEAWGLADVENSVPATAETVYRMGSIAKPLTALTALTLAEQGTLDLDAPVERYCPAFPSQEEAVTPRLLLVHQGGIRHYNYRRFREEFLSSTRYASPADAVEIFADDSLVAKPGSEYHYSSFGYVLLGCAIEGASGISFEAALEQQVLGPADMSQTTLDYAERIVPHRAREYGRNENGSWANATYVDLSDRFSAGGILSTPRDLVTFVNALLDRKLADASTLRQIWQPAQTANGEPTSYALGWRVSEDQREVFHGGTSVGGSAYLYVLLEERIVVAFATNVDLWTEPRHELARQLAQIFVR